MRTRTVLKFFFWVAAGAAALAQVVPNYQYPDAAEGLSKGFRFNISANLGYDGNIYYSVPGTEYRSLVTAITPQLTYRREGNRFFIRTQYMGIGEIYHWARSVDPDQPDLFRKNSYSNFYKLDMGYQVTRHLLLQIKDDLDNTNRPDFMQVNEMVYGKFWQNNFLVQATMRATDRLELLAGYGYHFTDYVRTDDSPNQDFINSRAHMGTAGFNYFFNSRTNFSFKYAYSQWTFPEDRNLNYNDHFMVAELQRQLTDQWHIRVQIGAQSRRLDSTLWQNGTNIYARLGLIMKREKSVLGIDLSRERSTAPNYSEDFYRDYWVRLNWRWQISHRNLLIMEAGFRWNDFENFPANFSNPLAGTRDDYYYFAAASIERRLRERFLIFASYRFIKRDSNNPFFDFNKHALSFGLKFLLQ